jgi:hypothetical protein
MRNFLRFFSLTVINQFCAVLYQIVLLPLQLRIWGHDMAAHWFVITALANLITVSDLGLRNAGHAQLLSSVRTGDTAAALEFRQTWALTRLLMIGLTLSFMAYQMWMEPTSFGLVWIVTASMAIDMILVVRGVWFDTMGCFTRVEAGFLIMVISRLTLLITALILFHASPSTLAWIMLGTGFIGLIAQSYLLRSATTAASLNLLAKGFRDLRWQSLSVIRLVVAEPAVTWARMSLPVIVFATIAPSYIVTTYVALRAVFGMARQMMAVLTRYASVQYVQYIENDESKAEHIVVRAILGSTIVGVAVSSMVIVDHCRLLHLWLGLGEGGEYPIIISFAIGTISFSYQVVANILMRSGDVVGVAKRQYIYLLTAIIAALIARFVANDALVYLIMLAGQELLIAGLFVASCGKRLLHASIAAFAIAACMLGALVITVEIDYDHMFNTFSPYAIMLSFTVACLITLITLIALLTVDYAFSTVKRPVFISETK